MAEFKVHHLVSQLFKELGVADGAEKYSETLTANPGSVFHLKKVGAACLAAPPLHYRFHSGSGV